MQSTNILIPKLSVFLLDLHRSIAHKGFAKILDISTGVPVEDPDAFSGRFVQIFLHQDLSTYLRKNRLGNSFYIIYHARYWYVHVASAFPLGHHYLAVLGCKH